MKRVLIIRPSAIGDIVMASPMIAAIRKAWPQAHIAWLADDSIHGILDHHPDLNIVIYWSKERWRHHLRSMDFLKLLSEIKRFSIVLRKQQFNLAIDAQGLFRSRFLAWLSHAEERVGLDSREPGRFFMTKIVSRGKDKRAMSSEYRQLIDSIGLNPGNFAPKIVLSRNDQNTADSLLSDLNVNDGFALFCPFTTRPHKHWFPERWAELANYLYEHFNLPSMILGAKRDKGASRQIRALADGPLHDITGQTSLGEAAAIVAHAFIVIGVDTGMTHMGTAFKRPTIALFGATCPYVQTTNTDTIVIYVPQTCAPCNRKPSCKGRYDCMAAITVRQVYMAVQKLLEQID
jgi:heptosyltransferase-1